MEYRKLIKFGESSHVVSLPNEWVKKNNMKKGDLVYFEQNANNELVLAPTGKEKQKVDKEISINVDGKMRKPLIREIVSAYLDNYTVLKFEGNEIAKKSELVREIIQNMVALEILEQTNKYILVKDFLDMSTLSIEHLIKKIDLIARALFLDVFDIIDGKVSESLSQKEQDINKLAFLTQRGIRYALESSKTAKPLELLSQWQLVTCMESFADEIKRFCRLFTKNKLDKNTTAKIKNIMVETNEVYTKTMKAYYMKDKKLAYDLAYDKDQLISMCDALMKKSSNGYAIPSLVDKMKAIVVRTKELGRVAY